MGEKKWNQKQNQKHFFDQSWYPQINENFNCEFFRSRTESWDPNSYRGNILHFTLRNIIHSGFNRTNKDFWTFLSNLEESNLYPNGHQHQDMSVFSHYLHYNVSKAWKNELLIFFLPFYPIDLFYRLLVIFFRYIYHNPQTLKSSAS